ncbi:CRISPR-associated endonuclease Cas2 [Gallibacterium anatis]|uniref:CRISPR-associated endoribonuclease Cas2 n=1 Tax=Gallibacterium anatis 12656/12 TaxID=1195244 RepID=U1GZ80_9PAST|nr:CRISPR-associated endonuclease Cas2 [Gallibacterium anatis]ERF77491.1 CRISPR-associated protein Cas2 [Gallibacterium anatis 12656/12]KGQ47965.1 CRISPR-associated protein Cas2 [Gallibacterium anatis]KGQ51827.1 CRISPR-associated protein Cas2 [Gallibacterium anatis]KGQ68278.1 CRISPR-associated protein Cas2 [Gallibacterium anatis]UZD16476.1 CRISPR-associated endonuclease Cas2 [Gallibacterium anatis]
MKQFVIGYDITDPKRLQKVYKQMQHFAIPLQYSIFLFEGTKEQLQKAIAPVIETINNKKDDLRIYELPSYGLKERIGKTVLPEGIVLTALPTRL